MPEFSAPLPVSVSATNVFELISHVLRRHHTPDTNTTARSYDKQVGAKWWGGEGLEVDGDMKCRKG